MIVSFFIPLEFDLDYGTLRLLCTYVAVLLCITRVRPVGFSSKRVKLEIKMEEFEGNDPFN